MRKLVTAAVSITALAFAAGARAQRPAFHMPVLRGGQAAGWNRSVQPQPRSHAIPAQNRFIASPRQRGPIPQSAGGRLSGRFNPASILRPARTSRFIFLSPYFSPYTYGYGNPWSYGGWPYSPYSGSFGSYDGYGSSMGYGNGFEQNSYSSAAAAPEWQDDAAAPPAPPQAFSSRRPLPRDLVVSMDGELLPASSAGSPLTVGSGHHTIEIRARSGGTGQ